MDEEGPSGLLIHASDTPVLTRGAYPAMLITGIQDAFFFRLFQSGFGLTVTLNTFTGTWAEIRWEPCRPARSTVCLRFRHCKFSKSVSRCCAPRINMLGCVTYVRCLQPSQEKAIIESALRFNQGRRDNADEYAERCFVITLI